jgi:hypothetical protein
VYNQIVWLNGLRLSAVCGDKSYSIPTGKGAMHCVVIRDNAFDFHRSVEILAYHQERREVRIHLVLIVQPRCPGPDAFLKMLHRGNLSCRVVPAEHAGIHLTNGSGARSAVCSGPFMGARWRQRVRISS